MTPAHKLAPDRCPRFDGCGAPLCPLDPHRHLRSYLKGEPTCLYLREWAKRGDSGPWTGTLPADLANAISTVAPAMCAAPGPHAVRLRRAGRTGSKIAAGYRLVARATCPAPDHAASA
jgi:hypothetical protein